MHSRCRRVSDTLHSSSILSDDFLWGNEEECEEGTSQHEYKESDVGSYILLAQLPREGWRGISTICYVRIIRSVPGLC